MQRKKLKIAEKEKASRPKKAYEGHRKKRKVEETGKDGNDKKDWNDNQTMDFIDMLEENPCSDSITGKSMSVAIFDCHRMEE